MADEDQDEIEALKARLAALEAGQSATPAAAQPVPVKAKGDGSGCLFAVLGGVVLMVLVLYAAGRTPAPESSAAQAAAAPSTSKTPCDVAWSSRFFQAMQKTSLVRGTEVTREGLIVVVRPSRWEQLGVEEQKRTAAAFDCAIAGETGFLKAVRFRGSLSGPDLEAFEATDLLRLRVAGYANAPPNSAAPRRGKR